MLFPHYVWFHMAAKGMEVTGVRLMHFTMQEKNNFMGCRQQYQKSCRQSSMKAKAGDRHATIIHAPPPITELHRKVLDSYRAIFAYIYVHVHTLYFTPYTIRAWGLLSRPSLPYIFYYRVMHVACSALLSYYSLFHMQSLLHDFWHCHPYIFTIWKRR